MMALEPRWLEDLLPSLRCPRCAGGLTGTSCSVCGAVAPAVDGLLDLAAHAEAPRGHESGGVLRRRVHRRLIRPLVRLVSGVDDAVDAGFLRQHVVPTGRWVLELGCGYGREARLLSSLLGDARVVAVDLSLPALQRARDASVGHGVAFLRADAAALPVADASVGAVNTFGLLHIVAEPAQVVREAARVLLPGGTLTGQTVLAPVAGVPRTCSRTVVWGAAADAGLVPVAESGSRGVVLFAFRKPG